MKRYASEVRAARKGKPVRLVLVGDALDGNHHQSGDVCTLNLMEQADIHIEIMIAFQKAIDWQRGDTLHYVKGTEVHTGEYENYIGKELNAIPDGDFYSWDMLKLETNSVMSWFVHHGATAGAGPNEGNGLRNWLKNIVYDHVKDNEKAPDIIYTGHVHNPTYNTFVQRYGMNYKTIHGVILPSWQEKTRYAWMKAPVSKNKIGGVIHEIKADGTITSPKFCVMGYK
jgi:hypothetical protein